MNTDFGKKEKRWTVKGQLRPEAAALMDLCPTSLDLGHDPDGRGWPTALGTARRAPARSPCTGHTMAWLSVVSQVIQCSSGSGSSISGLMGVCRARRGRRRWGGGIMSGRRRFSVARDIRWLTTAATSTCSTLERRRTWGAAELEGDGRRVAAVFWSNSTGPAGSDTRGQTNGTDRGWGVSVILQSAGNPHGQEEWR
jgi:hypothetical protein